jgi:hypothetical protein
LPSNANASKRGRPCGDDIKALTHAGTLRVPYPIRFAVSENAEIGVG